MIPIILHFSLDHPCRTIHHPVRRFEKIWLQDYNCAKVVKEVKTKANIILPNKLDHVPNQLSTWGHKRFGIIFKRIKEHQRALTKPNTKGMFGRGFKGRNL